MSKKHNFLMLIALLAIDVIFVAACSKKEEPAPTLVPTLTTMPTPTTMPAPTDMPQPETDDEWARIQAVGKMVVGTAADYPPFAYYTDDFQMDGFDIALIREIGQRLGVEIELFDFAFDGLSGALMLNQIDVAIAAISITPEREAVVDFSNVYFVGEDTILADQESDINAITTVTEMAGWRVGVQRGTVFEDWLETSLIDTGLMPKGNLFAYEKGEHAVRDLREGRLDLVVEDALPAEVAVSAGGVRMVGRGLNTQRFGIAMRPGAASLKTGIDHALLELQSEGLVVQLAKQYLDLEPNEIPPTPTPVPEPSATPQPLPPSCIDGMAFVKHLTLDDQDMTAPPDLAPGQPFAKSWRVRNSGTCTWDDAYSLVYVDGNVPAARMGGTPVAIQALVPSGSEYDIAVNLVAPLSQGFYQGFWQMRDGDGVPFGMRIWIGIRVPPIPTPTPAPTQTPAPGISFIADRTRIKAGERVVLTWNVQNVQAVYLYGPGEPWEMNGVPGFGDRGVWPETTTIYELRVVHRDNRVEIRQIRIEVEPVASAPAIDRFTVNPAYRIVVGQDVEIQWEVSGDVRTVRILRNDADLWADAPWAGRLQDSPPGPGEVRYAIEASGPRGTSRVQRVVNVIQSDGAQPTATPTPSGPVPGPPIIDAFAVSPGVVQPGGCVNISWSVGGDAIVVQLKRDGLVVLDNAPFSGAMQGCHGSTGTVVYRLEARNVAGQSIFREEPVSIVE